MVFLLSPKLPQRLLVAATLVAVGVSQSATAASNVVQVLVDQATLVRLDRPAAEIVVGNPSIADVSVQSGKVLVVTGKSFGETNLISHGRRRQGGRQPAVDRSRTAHRLRDDVPRQRKADPALRAVLHAAARDRRYAGHLRGYLQSDHDKAVYQPIRRRRREAVIVANERVAVPKYPCRSR